jgi:hypothetical protein
LATAAGSSSLPPAAAPGRQIWHIAADA